MLRKTFFAHTIVTLLTLIGVDSYHTSKALAQEIPKAQCLSAYGETKCGYSCVAAYGEIKCADWPGGTCKAAYGEIVCGPPAPPNWLNVDSNQSSSSNHSGLGIHGAWAVKLGKWSGILRMNGRVGNLVLMSNSSEIVEQRMVLKQSSSGGYVLDGEIVTWHNLASKYYADSIYFQQFSRKFSARSCDDNRNCSTVVLTYLGK